MAATGGNTGNVAFVHGTRAIISNPITRIGWGWSPEEVRSRVDQIVICCANQIGSHVDLGGWGGWLEQVGLPITLFGLGAQSEDTSTPPAVPEGTKRFLGVVQSLKSDAGGPNIAVRGEFSKLVLSELGFESVAAGCPSLFISPVRNLGERIMQFQQSNPLRRVAVAAGNLWHGKSAFLEKRLVEIVEMYRGEYVLQHPEVMIKFYCGNQAEISENERARALGVYGDRFDLGSLIDWYRSNATVYVDVPSWIMSLRRYELTLGPRYHGVALAVQAGRPACVIAIDGRTEELSAATGVKFLPLSIVRGMDADELVEACRWSHEDGERLDAARVENARSYSEFVSNNGLQVSDHLQGLVSF